MEKLTCVNSLEPLELDFVRNIIPILYNKAVSLFLFCGSRNLQVCWHKHPYTILGLVATTSLKKAAILQIDPTDVLDRKQDDLWPKVAWVGLQLISKAVASLVNYISIKQARLAFQWNTASIGMQIHNLLPNNAQLLANHN